jgi:broad specificity polyphosphatase/5'/3'-nucleotidase SurE
MKLRVTFCYSVKVCNQVKIKYFRCTRENHAMDNININSMHLEQVKSFKYLRPIVNGNNSIEEEIKESIFLGNKAYYANQVLFKR